MFNVKAVFGKYSNRSTLTRNFYRFPPKAVFGNSYRFPPKAKIGNHECQVRGNYGSDQSFGAWKSKKVFLDQNGNLFIPTEPGGRMRDDTKFMKQILLSYKTGAMGAGHLTFSATMYIHIVDTNTKWG